MSRRRYGTPRYGVKALRQLMMEWAKAERKMAIDRSHGSYYSRELVQFGQVLGAKGALVAVGALSDPQYEAAGKRVRRILNAKVTRGLAPAQAPMVVAECSEMAARPVVSPSETG